MPPRSNGRTPKYKSIEIKQAWKDYKANNLTGTMTQFAKEIGCSYSRVKAILNDHPSENKRKNNHQKNKVVHDLTEVAKNESKPKKEMIFYPNGWGW